MVSAKLANRFKWYSLMWRCYRYPHAWDIIFLTNQITVTVISCVGKSFEFFFFILYNKKKITRSLGDTKFIFSYWKILHSFAINKCSERRKPAWNNQKRQSYRKAQNDEGEEKQVWEKNLFCMLTKVPTKVQIKWEIWTDLKAALLRRAVDPRWTRYIYRWCKSFPKHL